MSRRTKEQRKVDYLDIGAALVAESAMAGGADPGLALSHVKLADVADRAGVTKGALYHVWPSQEAYWRDLLADLIERHHLLGAEQVMGIGTLVAAAAGPSPTLRDYTDALFQAVRSDPAFFARVSLFSYLDDDTVRSDLDAEFRSTLEGALPVLEAAIARTGRRLADGATIWDLAVAIGSVLEGLCLQYRISPDRTPDLVHEDGHTSSLFAAATEALVLGHTVATDESATGAAHGGSVPQVEPDLLVN